MVPATGAKQRRCGPPSWAGSFFAFSNYRERRVIVAKRNSKARSEDGTGDRRHGGVRASYRRNHSSFALLLLLERHFIPLIARQINPGTRIINGLSARSSTRQRLLRSLYFAGPGWTGAAASTSFVQWLLSMTGFAALLSFRDRAKPAGHPQAILCLKVSFGVRQEPMPRSLTQCATAPRSRLRR